MSNQKLIYDGLVITVDPEETIYQNGWVLIEDDVIVDVGDGPLPSVDEDAEKINALGKAVMPGIVNIHTHVCGTLFKGLTEDNKGSFYGLAFPMERFLTPESTYVLSMLGAIETVKFGSTCINDLYHHMRSTAKAVSELGMRGILYHKVYEPDLCNLQFNDYSPVPGQGMEKLEENVRLVEEYHGTADGRIECGFGPHATDTVSMELAKTIVDLAEKYNVRIHTHVAQKEQEVAYDKAAYGLTPVEYLVETGLAGNKLTAAHCVYLVENDAKLLSETGTRVSHSPEMMLKRGNFPDVNMWHRNYITFALGTDWVTMNPWTNMRFYITGWRGYGDFDEDDVNANLAFKKCTIDAARLIGKEDLIGSLEKGKKADVIIMDLSGAHLQPMYDRDILSTIVWNATGTEVETVLIDGHYVVKDGDVVTVDEKAVIEEAVAIARSYLARQLKRIE